jgi:hypothetical protein
MPDIWAGVPWLGASHSVSMAGILARFGRIDRRIREVTSRLDDIYTLVTRDS